MTPGTVVLPVEIQDTEGDLIKSGNPVAGTGPFIHTRVRRQIDGPLHQPVRLLRLLPKPRHQPHKRARRRSR